MRNNVTDYTLDARLIRLQFFESCISISVWSTNELYSRVFYRLLVLKIGKVRIFNLENLHEVYKLGMSKKKNEIVAEPSKK